MFPDCEYYFTSLFQLDALISGWFFLGWSLASIATMPLMTKIDELSEQEPQEKTHPKKTLQTLFLRSEEEVEPKKSGNVKKACQQWQWLSRNLSVILTPWLLCFARPAEGVAATPAIWEINRCLLPGRCFVNHVLRTGPKRLSKPLQSKLQKEFLQNVLTKEHCLHVQVCSGVQRKVCLCTRIE